MTPHQLLHSPYHPTPFQIVPKNGYINERHSTTLKLKKNNNKYKNVGNITSIIGYYPKKR